MAVTHPFVSAKADSADDTLVSAGEWNADHLFTGGANGQVLIFDNTQANNIRWTDGVRAYSGASIISVSTPTPIIDLAELTIVCGSPTFAYVTLRIDGYTAVGSAVGTFSLQANGSQIAGVNVVSGHTTPIFITTGVSFATGSHAIDVDVSTAGDVNITAVQLYTTAITFGT